MWDTFHLRFGLDRDLALDRIAPPSPDARAAVAVSTEEPDGSADVDGPDEALMGALDKAVADHPDAARGYRDRGDAWLNRGESARAIEDFNRAVECDPTHAGTFRRRGNYERAWNLRS